MKIPKSIRLTPLIPLVMLTMASCGGTDPVPSPPDVPPDPGVEQGTDPLFTPSTVSIVTKDGTPITGKEKADYVECTITINSDVEGWSGEYTGKIRGRGNSTWLWYPKKPYRIKLNDKAEILGLKEEKDWVLLANYRDPSHVMNSYVFAVGNALGRLPYTNSIRYVELTLNGDYVGLYQLTEQVEQGKKRVAVADDGGMLISLDKDDGPELSPDAEDNFWSSVYGMPICVKYPEDPALVNDVKADFAKLESAVKAADYDKVAELMDIPSFIDYMIVQELVFNVEVEAPRSIYMHKDVNGKWFMGPLWDFDAGFDFDWSTMYTGHNYFTSYKKLVLGTKPATHAGATCNVPGFFSDLFKNERFKQEYKDRWKSVSPLLVKDCWNEVESYLDGMKDAMARNEKRWPIDKNYQVEQVRMFNWLENRVDYLNGVIANY